MKRVLIATILSLQVLVSVAQSGATVNYVDGNLATIKQTAAVKSRPAVLIVGADWCGHTKYLYSQIMTNSKVVEEFNSKYVVSRFDAEKGEAGIEVATLYDVERYPMLIILDKNGMEIGRMVGIERSADIFLQKFREAAAF